MTTYVRDCLTQATVRSDEEDVRTRAKALYEEMVRKVALRADRLFGIIFVVQWMAALIAARWLSPHAWEGRNQTTHMHVYAALVLGTLITALPVVMLSLRRAATPVKRS